MEATRNWPIPITVKELRSFLGFTSYYRCLIKGYAKVTYPLYDQISRDNAAHKKRIIQWTDECKKVFNTLKALCTSAPILSFADLTKPSKLYTDDNTISVAAVLYQEQDANIG